MFAKVQPVASTVLRVVLAAVWVWAAVAKIGDPAAAVRAVRAYDLLPEWLAQGVGYGLPFLELALALLLLLGLATRLAAVVSAVLFAVFLAGIVSAAARGLQIECGCFGGGGETDRTARPLSVSATTSDFVTASSFPVLRPIQPASSGERTSSCCRRAWRGCR